MCGEVGRGINTRGGGFKRFKNGLAFRFGGSLRLGGGDWAVKTLMKWVCYWVGEGWNYVNGGGGGRLKRLSNGCAFRLEGGG